MKRLLLVLLTIFASVEVFSANSWSMCDDTPLFRPSAHSSSTLEERQNYRHSFQRRRAAMQAAMQEETTPNNDEDRVYTEPTAAGIRRRVFIRSRQLGAPTTTRERVIRKRGNNERMDREATERDAEEEEQTAPLIQLTAEASHLCALLGIIPSGSDQAHRLNFITDLSQNYPSRASVTEAIVRNIVLRYPLKATLYSSQDFHALLRSNGFNDIANVILSLYNECSALATTPSSLNPYARILMQDIFGLDLADLSQEIVDLANFVCSEDKIEARYQAFISMVAKLSMLDVITQTYINTLIARAKCNADLEQFFS